MNGRREEAGEDEHDHSTFTRVRKYQSGTNLCLQLIYTSKRKKGKKRNISSKINTRSSERKNKSNVIKTFERHQVP